MVSSLLEKKFDVFIAYHGDSLTGSEAKARDIYDFLTNQKVNGRFLDVFFQPVTNMDSAKYGDTKIIVNNCKMLILVVNSNIPRNRLSSGGNGSLLSVQDDGSERELFGEISSFYNGFVGSNHPDHARLFVYNWDPTQLNEPPLLHPLFHKRVFFTDSTKTQMLEWIGNALNSTGETSVSYYFKKLKKVLSGDINSERPSGSSIGLKDIDILDYYVSMPTDRHFNISVMDRKITHIDIDEDNTKYDCSSFFSKLQNDLLNEECSYGMNYPWPLYRVPSWKTGFHKSYRTINGIDLICATDLCLLVGSAGTGKSTVFKILARILAEQYFSYSDKLGKLTSSDIFFQDHYFPIFISLKQFSTLLSDMAIEQNEISWNHILKYLSETYSLSDSQLSEIDEEISNNPVVFLFDGIDEIFSDVSPTLSFLSKIVTVAEQKGLKRKIAFSSRDNKVTALLGNEPSLLSTSFSLLTARLQPMDYSTRAQLTKRLFIALNGSGNLSTINYKSLDQSVNSFFDNISLINIDNDILNTPIFLCLIASLYRQKGVLPENKGQLLKESIYSLIERWQLKLKQDLAVSEDYSEKELYNCLREIAYQAALGDDERVKRIEGKLVINRRDLQDYIMGYLFSINHNISLFELQQLVNNLVNDIGIMVPSRSGNSYYEFSHRNFQEYLAAEKEIEETCYFGNYPKRKVYRFISSIEDESFRSIMLTCTEVLLDGELYIALWSLIDRIVNSPSFNPMSAWFTAKTLCLRNAKAYLALLEEDLPHFESTINLLKQVLSKNIVNTDISYIYRAESAEYLGVLGDSRLGVGCNKKGVPNISWCFVPKGVFTMGLTADEEEALRNNPKFGLNIDLGRENSYQRNVRVDSFYIAKYPITVMQYQAFIDDGGYSRNSQWWGWSDVAQYYFEEKIKCAPPEIGCRHNAPVVNVSWIEAMSFCRWLSNKLGFEVRLPLEKEWEYAARRKHRFFYNSEVFNPSLYACADTVDPPLSEVVPVGLFDFSVADDEPSDLTGNCWEWTECIITQNESLAYFKKCEDYKKMIKEQLEVLRQIERSSDISSRVFSLERMLNAKAITRGGSFKNPEYMLRTTYRGRDLIGQRIPEREGFRIVAKVIK